MARYTGAVCRLCRREGTKLFLKGDRCNSHKCAFQKRAFPPGQHGSARKMKVSEYGLQLREKQKAKRFFGVLEKQFKNYFTVADSKKGVTGEALLLFIERRLDNIVFVLGLLPSRRLARQMIIHGHILVNDKPVDRPSYLLKEGDIISIKQASKDLAVFKTVKENKDLTVPTWLEIDKMSLKGKLIRFPKREEMAVPVNEQLIVELYSK